MLPPLPVDEVLPELLESLRREGCAILKAPPGSGKTTRVPPALLDLAKGQRVVVLEPRRVAARAAARRIAFEQGWQVGEEIGYQIRFERRASPTTRLLVVTEGILTRMLGDDPFLEGIAVVVFDEFHERSLDSDLALALARAAQLAGRDDLRLCVLSATLDEGPVARYLGGCPVVTSHGRPYPVAVEHVEVPDRRPLHEVAAGAVRRLLPQGDGDLLVFLPGVGEIRRTAAALEATAAERGLAVVPLYGDLPSQAQDRALTPGPERRVVLATNVAESSVTVEGVDTVVDSGLARVPRADPGLGLDRLELVRISRSSATQRAGRAGRTGPGRCLRLWTRHDERSMKEGDDPEIRRLDLAGPVLTVRAWGAPDAASFPWLEAPPPQARERAEGLLELLGATRDGTLTDTGRTLARLPLHPRLGRLLIETHRHGHLEAGALAAALLADRPPRSRADETATGHRESGDSDLVERLEKTTRPGPLLRRAQDQLMRLARRELGPSPAAVFDQDEALLRALLAAYPDRVARRREPGSDRGVMVGGRGIRLAPTSIVLEPELFVCLEIDAGRRGEHAEALVRQASRVESDWLDPSHLRSQHTVTFDDEAGRVVAWQRRCYRDLVLEEHRREPAAEEAAAILAEAAAGQLHHALSLDDPRVAQLRARVAFLGQWRPELDLPPLDEARLLDLLPVLCAGRRSFAELRQVLLHEVLAGLLTPPQRQALERDAPDRLEVPSGSRLPIVYREDEPPVLRVRIQELFGLDETPRVGGGRVPVLLHLLAPSGRPQQVTDDLASFWRHTYPEVRRELRGRYPKHAWPENPMTASPERRPRRRR